MKVNFLTFFNMLLVAMLSISCGTISVDEDKKKNKKTERTIYWDDRPYFDRW